jgi:hypothetical protein
MNSKPANIALGIIALTADLLGIVSFALSGEFAKFWSANWLVYVFSLTLLMGVAFFFFFQAKDDRVNAFYPLAAGMYALLSCIALFALYAGLSGSVLTLRDFAGMGVLSIFPAAMALGISLLCENPASITKTISYFYASSGLIAVIYLLFRYQKSSDFSWVMAGELLGLTLIGIGFVTFAFADKFILVQKYDREYDEA